MDHKKEYIQISKEDFERIYKTIDQIKEELYRESDKLLRTYDILAKLKGILERVIKKSILAELEGVKYDIDHTRNVLIYSYSYLNKLMEESLDKIKRKQIDKNNG